MLTVQDRVQLILARIEILKLKADEYNWQCHTTKLVKDMLEKSLAEIDSLLEAQEAQEAQKALVEHEGAERE